MRRPTGEAMSGIAVGSIIFAMLMVMLVIRIPIGIAMFVTGAGGIWRSPATSSRPH